MTHPVLGEIECVRSPRARRVSIRVRASGDVRLVYPCGVSEMRALAFLEEKIPWVEAARERLSHRRAALPPQLPPAEEKARVEMLRRAAKADLPVRIGGSPPRRDYGMRSSRSAPRGRSGEVVRGGTTYRSACSL